MSWVCFSTTYASSVCLVVSGGDLLLSTCSVQVKQLQNPETVFETIIGLVVRLAEKGLIHCDFNEFNIMVRTFLGLVRHS